MMRAAFGRTAVGRADLVRLIATMDEESEQARRVARLLGFEPPAPQGEVEVAPVQQEVEQTPVVAPAKERPHMAPSEAARMPFWRLEAMDFTDDEPPAPTDAAPAGGLTDDDLRGPGRSLLRLPPSPPLARWSRLWPVLRDALHTSMPRRDPDVPALIRAFSRGDIVTRIPRIRRQAWSGSVSVWVDRSARLVPFWSDQTDVCVRLRRVCGQSGLAVRLLTGRAQARLLTHQGGFLAGVRPDPKTPVLVLGDLGAHGSSVEHDAWLEAARRLRRAGVRVAALVPSSLARLDPALVRAWSAIPWERGRHGSVARARSEPLWKERAERLLQLAAPAALVQPGLLRALRRLLPAWQTDAGSEADAWNHADVRAADITGMVLHTEAAERWRASFAREVDEALKRRVRERIRRWHAELPPELRRGETLVWHGLVGSDASATPGELADAVAFSQRLAVSLRSGATGDPTLGAMLRHYTQALLGAMPDAAYGVAPSLQTAWALAFAGVTGVRVPSGIDPKQLRAEIGTAPELRHWALRQVGSRLVCATAADAAWPSRGSGPGSPVALLLAARPYVYVRHGTEGRETQLVLAEGLTIALPPESSLELRTDRCTLRLRPWRREEDPWAVGAGRDRWGLWADVEIQGVVQRFRWIPPGRFWMGSPEREAGRWDDEGPQHLVTWTRGRWLADTPVTQALWTAVMGKNPSEFVSPDRPVERVSWDGCKKFLAKVVKLAPGLDLRLPSEAEWEYACRGGTTGATWLGDLEIHGENNAPLLDDIAWYGGNSGQGFELPKGMDSSTWPNKQSPHTRAGTRLVRGKAPNPYGLYDMLGNIFEWCEDELRSYDAAPMSNPRPHSSGTPTRTGSYRVLRGGSWDSLARRVRAAHRLAYPPDSRYSHLGFRLARGQEPVFGAEPLSVGAEPRPRSGSWTRARDEPGSAPAKDEPASGERVPRPPSPR